MLGSNGSHTFNLNNNATSAASSFTINTDLLVTSTGTKTLSLGGTNTGNNTFGGDITNGSGTVALTKTGAGKWILSGTNTYSGATINAFNNPAGAGLVFEGIHALSPTTTLQQTHAGGIGGFDPISILDDSAVPASRPGVNLNMLASNTSHGMLMYVDRISGANTGSTVELGNLNFTQNATGNSSQTLTVTGGNGYGLRINNVNVTLHVAATTWTASLTPTTARLTVAGNVRQLAGSAGTTTLALQGSAAGNQVSGDIMDSADEPPKALSLTKSGSSTWTLFGNNSYSGPTTVSGGKLFINGNQTPASGGINVAANATLGGTGTLGGDTAVATNGRLEFDLSTPAGSHDKLELAVGRVLTFSGASTLTIISSGGATPGNYTLLTAPGGIVGSVPATLNLPSGWAATITKVSNSLVLNVTSTGQLTPYQQWANGAFSSPFLDQGPGSNPDNDDLTNLQEFAFGTDPTSPVSGSIAYVADQNITRPGLPVIRNMDIGQGAGFHAVFGRRKDYVAAGLTYSVQFSADLGNWVTSGQTPALVTAEGSSGDLDAVSIPFPASIDTGHGPAVPTFFRIGVLQPTP